MPRPSPVAQFHALVNEALPEPRATALVSTRMLRLAAPFHRISRESLPLAYQWTEPFLVDDSAFRARFPDFVSTPMAEAVATTVAHYRDRAGIGGCRSLTATRRGAARRDARRHRPTSCQDSSSWKLLRSKRSSPV